jgi:hypothetical protein
MPSTWLHCIVISPEVMHDVASYCALDKTCNALAMFCLEPYCQALQGQLLHVLSSNIGGGDGTARICQKQSLPIICRQNVLVEGQAFFRAGI